MRRRSNTGLFQRLMEAGSRTTYHGKIRTRGGKRSGTVRQGKQSVYKGIRIVPVGDGEFETALDSSRFDSLRDAKRFIDAWKKQGNPASYHGMPSAKLEQMLIYANARAYDDDWMVRQQGRKDVEAIEHALKNARKREAKRNPPGTKGRFERCVKAVSERGGAIDPRAVCGAQEQQYRGNPEGSTAYVGAQRKDGKYPVQLVYPGSGKRLHKLMTAAQIEELRAKGYNVYGSSRNPADSAVEAYKIFHGREPEELITIAKQRHYHKHLAAAGELERLVIEYPVGNGRKVQPVTLTQFKGALLAFNEQALPELAKRGKVKLTQLFIEGGDQTVNLEDFGIDPDNVHEIETLGKAVKIDYFTTKDHLGSEGGTATYGHKFRSTNKDGKHVTVKIAKYPDVIYRVRDNQLEFSGGSYEIRAEGIDK